MTQKVNYVKIGESVINKQGDKAFVKEFLKNKKLLIEFEDGTTKEILRNNFRIGNFAKNKNRYYHSGMQNQNSEGYTMTILENMGKNRLLIRFEDTGNTANITATHFKTGKVKNRFHRSVLEVGFVGDAKCEIKSYECWKRMMTRCYDSKFHEKNPSYKDCSVDEIWHNYSNFKKWYDENYYSLESEKVALDKDIKKYGNKIYGPHNCMFVPLSINSFYSSESNIQKFYRPNSNSLRFPVRCADKYIGTYDTEKEAELAYKKARRDKALELANSYKNKIPSELHNILIKYSLNKTLVN